MNSPPTPADIPGSKPPSRDTSHAEQSAASLKPKHQRLVLVVIALIAIIGAGILAAYGLQNQASYFYVPADIAQDPPPPTRAVRLGGMVRKGSLETMSDGVTVSFVVEDSASSVPVRYSGILPDLFTEGSGVVAEGKLDPNGTFVADNLLAKHDENYVPRELEHMTQAERERVAEAVSR